MPSTAIAPRIRPEDIIKERTRSKQIVWWISEDCLLANFPALTRDLLKYSRRDYVERLDESQRKRSILPDTGKAWRFRRENGRFYYAYQNIPDKAPTHYKSRLENPETLFEQAKNAPIVDELAELEKKLLAGIEQKQVHLNPLYTGYTRQQREKLTLAAAAMDVFAEMCDQDRVLDAPRALCPMLRKFCAVAERNSWPYLPKNWRVMKQKIDAYAAGTPLENIIDLPRRNNANAIKFDDERYENWLVYLRGKMENWSDAEIIRKVVFACAAYGLDAPSDRWMRAKLNDPHVRWLTQGRYGGKGKHRHLYNGYVPVSGALSAGDCWQMDGTRVNFIGWQEGKKTLFLYGVFVRDMYSGALLGFHFSVSEDTLAYVDALRMACINTGYLPYEVITDRFPGHKTAMWQSVTAKMQANGTKMTIVKTATGKAQIERAIGSWQSMVLQNSAYYYGEGIRSTRKNAHRPEEHIAQVTKVAKADGWCFDAAWTEAARCIEAWNTMPQLQNRRLRALGLTDAPLTLHNQSEKPNVYTVGRDILAQVFGQVRPIQVRHGMVRLEVFGIEHLYQLPAAVAANHREVLVAFDPMASERAWIYAGSDPTVESPILLAEVERTNRVLVTGPNAEWGKVSAGRAAIKQIEAGRRAEMAEINEKANPDIALLMGARASKADQEAAETQYYLEQFGERDGDAGPVILNQPVENEEPEAAPIEAQKGRAHSWMDYATPSRV